MHTKRILRGMAAALAAVLVSCGGGDGQPVAGIQGSGILGASFAVGRITGFGSIFVNGVEYQTTGATFRVDDAPGVESDLRVGQVVRVRGTVNASGTTGTASEVVFDDEVQGPVGNLDIAAGTFTVLGQRVRVDAGTIFDRRLSPASIDGLAAAGLVVEVSGFRNAQNEIVATRIEPESSTSGFEVKAVVASLDATARTFRLGSLTVDYAAATVEGTLANGVLVEAKGIALNASGALRATKVEVESGLGAAANDRGEIEGVVTRYVSNTDFDVNGIRVTTDGTTRFELGGVALAVNVRVEVEGTFNASGVLVARKVEAEIEDEDRVRGTIDAITGNTLRVLGVTATVSATTEYEDKSAAQLRQLRLSDLRTGDFVELRGSETSPPGSLVVSLVERLQPEGPSFVEGVARSLAAPTFGVLGLSVTTNASTQFRDTADAAITSAQFFARAANQRVKARGVIVSGSLVAEQVELED